LRPSPRDKATQRVAAITCLCSAVGLLLLVALPASAQETLAVVRPDPLVLEIGEGQAGALDIVLENAQDVYAIDVRASFDPDVLEVVDADPNRDGVQMVPGAFLKPDFLVRNVADNQAGTLWYALTQVNPSLPATGTGVLFSVRLRGKTAGRSQLKIGFVEMANRRGGLLAVQPQDGTIRVTAAGVGSTAGAVAPAATARPTSAPATLSPTPSTEPAPSPTFTPAGGGGAQAGATPAAAPTAAPEPGNSSGAGAGCILPGASMIGLGGVALWVTRRGRRSQGGQR
jgi:hypothetical protein